MAAFIPPEEFLWVGKDGIIRRQDGCIVYDIYNYMPPNRWLTFDGAEDVTHRLSGVRYRILQL